MPTDEALTQKAEEWKAKGNEAFQKGSVDEAIQAYSQGIVACDRVVPSPNDLKATMLSNRAMCHLKAMSFQPCIDDCTTALNLDTKDDSGKLRAKLFFRRAKASFLLFNVRTATGGGSASSSAGNDQLLQDAAKDLLGLLQIDPKNTEANKLLASVRAQHKLTQTAVTPVSKTLDALKNDDGTPLHNVKVLLGLLDNDTKNASSELGRLGGIKVLLDLAQKSITSGSAEDSKIAILSLQCISAAASYPTFVRDYLNAPSFQADVARLVQNCSVGTAVRSADFIVSALAILVRIILHLDRDDPEKDIEGKTGLDYQTIVKCCNTALNYAIKEDDKTVTRAVLDVLTTWTAGTERDSSIRASLGGGVTDPLLPIPATQSEIRNMTPQETAAYRKRQSDKKTRDGAWAFERSILLIQSGGLKTVLRAATSCQDHVVRREITVVVGRILNAVESEDKIKELVKPFLGNPDGDEKSGVIIEEVYTDEDGKEIEAEEEEVTSLETMMERAIVCCALLLSRSKEEGGWAIGGGWRTSVEDLETMINSSDPRAMCLASEVISAAATIETAHGVISNLMKDGFIKKLITSEDRDIRSGAASAITKVGLADKATGSDEAEIMSLLVGACDLLEDKGDKEEINDTKGSSKLHSFSSFATSSVERAIEMITYLVANTSVKEELAAGFQAPGASHSALERLVEVSDVPSAGESLAGFGLATIFQHIAVTNLQLRREMFEGKEVTMEQYDEMQKMGKTEEEKEMMELEKDPDTQDACNERIRKMASANVPRAMVTLMEGASEHTLEQLVLTMNRMAAEPSVRGIMIQQGVLSACIKVEKNEGPTETDTMKKVIQLARHCIAKLLITTNPALLTSAQKLGSVRPLLQLIRDIKASDLQHFEALLAITNVASAGEDAKNKIVTENGIPPLHFEMFSDHEMVQRAATEAMCNLVPHKAMMDHLANADNLKLWLAFASDAEGHYECARAAAGCLAMATQDESIAIELSSMEKFGAKMNLMLECGRLEIMHRALYIVLNLAQHGGQCRQSIIDEGLVVFCRAYVENFHDKQDEQMLEFPEEERQLLPVTIDLAKKIVSLSE